LSRQSNQNERTIAYLLGTLSDEERARIEERYFSDDAEFEELEIAEDELIDGYVRGELSPTQSQLFEKRMSESPRLIQRVEFARAWANRIAGSAAESSTTTTTAPQRHEDESWWSRLFGFPGATRTPRFATAFVVLLLFIGGAALFAGWLKWKESKRLAAEQAALEQRQREVEKQAADLKSQSEQIANQTRPQPSPIEVRSPIEAASPQERTAGPRVIALALSPGATRGDGGTTIQITPGTSVVAVDLQVRDTDYASYQASVQTMERTTVFSSSPSSLRRTRSGATFSFSVPANRLPVGDYLVSVDGLTPTGAKENVHYYRFRVTR